jgi:hypothetical protein
VNEQDRIRTIKEKAEEVLFRIPGVHGVGIGHKASRGLYTNELSIKVYVIRKKPPAEVPAAQMIPAEIEGVKTDVVQSGPPKPLAEDTKEYRPVRGGTCIKIQEETQVPGSIQIHGHQGTIGCIARTTGNPSIIVGLTNHHVLSLDGTNLPKGKPVGQTDPSEYSICSKCCSEIIGVVLDGLNNLAVDVALITLNRKLNYYNQVQDEPNNFLIKGTYSLQTKGIPKSPYHVKKRGSDTRLTTGTIDSTSTNFIDAATHTITHTNVIGIQPDSDDFAKKGDSGSVLVSNEGSDDGNVLGLMFGGDPGASGFGFACDIDVVKAQLSNIHLPIEILTASSLDDKQTVPDSAVQANAYAVDVVQGEEAARVANADLQLFQRAREDLLRTEEGEKYVGLFQRHHQEVRTLINTNKRVATAGPHCCKR